MLPNGLPYKGSLQSASHLKLLTDITYTDSSGVRCFKQHIFDEVFAIIASARHFVLLDMFLYNSFQGSSPELHRRLSSELTGALLAARNNHPDMLVIVITDPINTLYGGLLSSQFTKLKAAGVEVVETRLDLLPDSNTIYSLCWRLLRSFFKPNASARLPNPFGEGKVPLYSYLALFNFKANHRKTLVADCECSELVALVTSGNPQDGSSAHHNLAVKYGGAAVLDVLLSERIVLDFSKANSKARVRIDELIQAYTSDSKNGCIEALDETLAIQVVTERCIKEAVLKTIEGSREGDALSMVMFYLSDRDVIFALKQAQRRHVNINILLDPNKDAFGRAKKGIPNRAVAWELNRSGITVRWCDTHGEQCHTKMIYWQSTASGTATLISGSANFTRRNLDNFNLETDVVVSGAGNTAFFDDVQRYIDTLWGNRNGMKISAEYGYYSEGSAAKWLLYRAMEASGLSTF